MMEYGEPITIITKNPVIQNGKVVEDERGHTVYVEDEIDTIARIKLMMGMEILVENGVLDVGDAQGLFFLEDRKYINSRSKISYKQTMPDGYVIETQFRCLSPIVLKTHLETNLKRVEF